MLLLCNTSLPQGALEPLDEPLPELTLAPVNAEGHWELLLNEALQHMTWHESQRLVWAFEGMKPFGEAPHGYPLNLLDPYFEAPVEGGPNITMLKAQRPAFNKTAYACTNPLLSLGATATGLDACIRASVLLEGEQNIKLSCEGCKQHATPCIPQNFLLPLSDTHVHGIVPGKGTAPI